MEKPNSPPKPVYSKVSKAKAKPYVYSFDTIEQFASLINTLQPYLESDSDKLQELKDTIGTSKTAPSEVVESKDSQSEDTKAEDIQSITEDLDKLYNIPQVYLDRFPDYSLLDFTNILVDVLNTDHAKFQDVKHVIYQDNDDDQADAKSKAKIHTEVMGNYYIMIKYMLKSYSSPLTKSKPSKKNP